MELSKIEQLLDKYFEGKTTLQEENDLKKYFSQAFVPTHLEQYKAMFTYFSQSKEEKMETEIKLPKENKKIIWYKYVGIAAILVVSFTIIQLYPTKNEIKLTQAEQKEAQRAFNETKKAFQLISKNLNKGNNAIAYLDEFESTKNKIFKHEK